MFFSLVVFAGMLLQLAAQAASVPTLTITQSGANVQLSWPASATDWMLCSRDDLASGDWQLVTAVPTVSAGQNVVTLPIAAARGAFQLRHRGAVVPFLTYEAEAAENGTTGTMVQMTTAPSSTTSTPELEASGRAYVQLTNVGEKLDFVVKEAANALVLRHCIPDAPTGGGITATLSLYVNGVFRQSLALNSRHYWLYGHAPNTGTNGQSNDPTAGTPHVFWGEMQAFISGGVQAGDVLTFQKDAGDTEAFYRIDCLDLEAVAAPLAPPTVGTYLSVTDYGATGNDTTDDTTAIASCITAAKAAGKSVWIPAGIYYQSANFLLDGVTVRGAGMWHTQLVGTVEGTSFAGNIGFVLTGSGATVMDLAIDSDAHTRRSTGGKPFTRSGTCTNWRVENVWITHSLVGFWMSAATNGVIRGCRVRNTYADAINLNVGASNNLVEHCHVRGSGDDGLAILSETTTATVSTGNTLQFNTVVATWWGHNCDLAGGSGHVIRDNYLADNADLGAFTINLPGAFPMHPLTGAEVRRNTIVRGGGNLAGQKRGAMWLSAGSTTVSGVTISDNEIRGAIFRGIHLAGAQSQTITFARNVIDRPGENAVHINSGVVGSGTFTGNIVRNLNSGFVQFSNNAPATYTTTSSGNTW